MLLKRTWPLRRGFCTISESFTGICISGTRTTSCSGEMRVRAKQEEVFMMLDTKFTTEVNRERDDFCDVRIWSGDCKHSTYQYSGDKYLCDVCESIPELDHEVR